MIFHAAADTADHSYPYVVCYVIRGEQPGKLVGVEGAAGVLEADEYTAVLVYYPYVHTVLFFRLEAVLHYIARHFLNAQPAVKGMVRVNSVSRAEIYHALRGIEHVILAAYGDIHTVFFGNAEIISKQKHILKAVGQPLVDHGGIDYDSECGIEPADAPSLPLNDYRSPQPGADEET